MSTPIAAGRGLLAAIISSLMTELGLTEYTLKTEGMEEKLEGIGIETFAEFENEDDKVPTAFIVKITDGPEET